MSGDKRVPPYRKVTVEVCINEPALVPATFDLVRLLAKASDLPDVIGINALLTVEFSGHCHEHRVRQLKHRLEDQFWLGDVTKNEVVE